MSMTMSNIDDEHNATSFSNIKEMPLVFQCAKCYAIIGDSSAWVGAEAELRAIVLSKLSSKVKVEKDHVTSREGYDRGSTYNRLLCTGCNKVIGHLYNTTPRALDNIRDFYTLFVAALESYQVGSMTQECSPPDNLFTQSGNEAHSTEIKKMKVLIVELSRRIEALEMMANASSGGKVKNAGWSDGQSDHSIQADHSDDDEWVVRRDEPRAEEANMSSSRKKKRPRKEKLEMGDG